MKMILIYIAIIIFAIFLFTSQNLKVPPEIGLIGDQLAPIPNSPNAVSSQTTDTTKYVPPLPLHHSLEDSKKTIISIIEKMNCTVLITSDVYIHAVASSPTFKFRDDIEFFFDTKTQLIHYRSASRTGYYDFNMNRKRYEDIEKEYNK